MKLLRFLVPLFAAISLASAQQPGPQDGPPQVPKEMLQQLFSAEISKEQLETVIKAANQAGVARQQILEAKLIWGLRHQDEEFLLKIQPELEVLAANFDVSQSAGLRSAEEVKSFLVYVKAIEAKRKGDAAGFKQNILEAIWLNPAQAAVFTQAIEQQQRVAKMGRIVIDMKITLTNSAGEATTLEDQLDGKKALLLDFWASWCGPCMQLMPELKKKADVLAKHGIVVAGMNKDDKEPESTAERVRHDQDISFAWLVEPMERPFSKLLEIDSIPRMILLSPEGKILFNGHPQDPELWTALKKLDPTIQAPAPGA